MERERTSCMVSSASSGCPQTFILKEYTVFCSKLIACSTASGVFRRSSSVALISSGRIDWSSLEHAQYILQTLHLLNELLTSVLCLLRGFDHTEADWADFLQPVTRFGHSSFGTRSEPGPQQGNGQVQCGSLTTCQIGRASCRERG